MNFDALPGFSLIATGLRDLENGVESAEALLVLIGRERLRRAGVAVPRVGETPDVEHRLYELLALEDSDSAHSRYNALIRQLVSFERAAECAR
jgi:hypothetical protein